MPVRPSAARVDPNDETLRDGLVAVNRDPDPILRRLST
jgi:hypothetical protein